MDKYEIVLVISTMLGLLATVIALISKLTTPIQELTIQMVEMNANFKLMSERDTTRDRRIDKIEVKNDDRDKTLKDHEERIAFIEYEKQYLKSK